MLLVSTYLIYIYIYSKTYISLYNYFQFNSTNFDNKLSGYSGITTDPETKHIYTLLNASKKLYDNYLDPSTPTANTTIPLNSYSYPSSETSYFTSNGLRFYKTIYTKQFPVGIYHLTVSSDQILYTKSFLIVH
jgi:hypothetical protein